MNTLSHALELLLDDIIIFETFIFYILYLSINNIYCIKKFIYQNLLIICINIHILCNIDIQGTF